MDSLVSIILPVYNGQKFLDSAIKSILSQSYENLELIIINDASTDKSSEIIENYSRIDQRVNVIDNEVNNKIGIYDFMDLPYGNFIISINYF